MKNSKMGARLTKDDDYNFYLTDKLKTPIPVEDISKMLKKFKERATQVTG